MSDLRIAAQQALEALYQAREHVTVHTDGPWQQVENDCHAAITAIRAALAQQDEPVEPVPERASPCRLTECAGKPMCPFCVRPLNVARAECLKPPNAPPQRDALLQALQNLMHVCQRMDLEHQAQRPSEAEYQAVMQAAQAAIQAVEGAA